MVPRSCSCNKSGRRILNTLKWINRSGSIPGSATGKKRFPLQLYTRLPGFKYDFFLFWKGAHRNISPRPLPHSFNLALPSIQALSSIHPAQHVYSLSQQRGTGSNTIFPQSEPIFGKFLDPPLGKRYRFLLQLYTMQTARFRV